jgi:cell pole-organizing protein PopZ
MSDTNAPEPTMEEILASIRRIISEDEPPPAPAAAATPEPEIEPFLAPEPEHHDILELTEPVLEPEPEPQPEPEPERFQTIGDLDIHPAPAPRAAAPSAPPPISDYEPLVGDIAADTAASAFGQLAQHVLMPGEGRTLEDVVREMLKPLLKGWLDTHLPGIVQAKVDEEVARIARRRV